MSDLALSPARLSPTSAPLKTPDPRVRETAEAFEASFLSQMLKPMFEGLSTDGPFGGGEAEGRIGADGAVKADAIRVATGEQGSAGGLQAGQAGMKGASTDPGRA